MMREFVEDKTISSEYMISNNLNANKINYQNTNLSKTVKDKDILDKLNYIINMFEEEKTIKTNQKMKNCFILFLRIFYDLCIRFFC